MKRELIQVSKNVRVENGPARKMATATKALLDDAITASHYQIGFRDALGEPITLGEPMTYLDYYGEWVWYVYKLDDGVYQPAGIETTKERALRAAELLGD